MSLCDSCNNGNIVLKEIKNFKVVLAGKKVSVPVAKIRVCDNCNAEYWPAKEMIRWANLPEFIPKKKLGKI